MPNRIYLDANCLIAILESGERMRQLVEARATGEVTLVTSELTLLEVLVKPIRDNDAALVTAYREAFAERDLLEPVPVDVDVLTETARRRAEDGSKTADAIHVATALLAGCTHMVSSDRRLRTPDRLPRVSVEDAADRRTWPW